VTADSATPKPRGGGAGVDVRARRNASTSAGSADTWARRELDLRVVGGEERPIRMAGHERAADPPPSGVRIGMFWRFGDWLDRRPVDATVWLNVVWIRPSRR